MISDIFAKNNRNNLHVNACCSVHQAESRRRVTNSVPIERFDRFSASDHLRLIFLFIYKEGKERNAHFSQEPWEKRAVFFFLPGFWKLKLKYSNIHSSVFDNGLFFFFFIHKNIKEPWRGITRGTIMRWRCEQNKREKNSWNPSWYSRTQPCNSTATIRLWTAINTFPLEIHTWVYLEEESAKMLFFSQPIYIDIYIIDSEDLSESIRGKKEKEKKWNAFLQNETETSRSGKLHSRGRRWRRSPLNSSDSKTLITVFCSFFVTYLFEAWGIRIVGTNVTRVRKMFIRNW